MENDISNYFMECPDCGYKCRLHDADMSQYAVPQCPTMSQCPRCLCRMSLMCDLNREQCERLMNSVSLEHFNVDPEDDDIMLIIFTLLGMPLPKVPYAYFAQSCWYHIQHMPVTESTKVAMKYYEERFAKSVANLAHVEEKDTK
jgi:hypothetical protein